MVHVRALKKKKKKMERVSLMLGHFVAYNFINAVLKLVFQIHVMLFLLPVSAVS